MDKFEDKTHETNMNQILILKVIYIILINLKNI